MVLLLIFFPACSIKKFAMHQMAKSLTNQNSSTIELPPGQRESIRSAAAKVVPESAKIDVSVVQTKALKGSSVTIAGHLLENEETESTNPYVCGNYATHQKLERVAQIRAYRILKSVLIEAQIDGVSELDIDVRHGVRVTTVTTRNGIRMPPVTSDQTRIIYSVSINLQQRPRDQWVKLEQDAFMSSWVVVLNIIPSLEIRSVYR